MSKGDRLLPPTCMSKRDRLLPPTCMSKGRYLSCGNDYII
jgi:hypothetical protein